MQQENNFGSGREEPFGEWLTRKQAAAYLGLALRTLDRLRARGHIRAHVLRGTGTRRFRRSDLDAAFE